MGHSYDDSRYGVITRKWFGLTVKHGGETAAGFTFGTGDAGPDSTQVTRYYPKAPCDIIKFGFRVLGTVSHGASTVDRCISRLYGRGASASLMASINIADTANAYVVGSIESSDTTDFAITQVKAGEYISIKTATKETDNGTDLGSTLTGTLAFFIDIVPKYDPDRWDAEKSTYQA